MQVDLYNGGRMVVVGNSLLNAEFLEAVGLLEEVGF